MPDSTGWLTIAPVLAILIGQTILGTMMIRQIAKQVSDLHDWHDQKDSDGVYVWYVRQSLEKAIVKLADNIEQQTMLLRQFIYERKKGS